VRTGENRHEKQRENKPFEGNAEKEEYKEEPEKIERGEKVSNVIPCGDFGSSESYRCGAWVESRLHPTLLVFSDVVS
jgi:hypothetical protein